MKKLSGIMAASLALILWCGTYVHAQPEEAPRPSGKSFPVTVMGRTVFSIVRGNDLLSAEERALVVSKRLGSLLQDKTFDKSKLSVKKDKKHYRITYEEDILFLITKEDAEAAGKKPGTLAAEYLEKIKASQITIPIPTPEPITETGQLYDLFNKHMGAIINLGIGAGSLLILGVIIWLFNRLIKKFIVKATQTKDRWLKPVRFRDKEVMTGDTVLSTFIIVMNAFRLFMTVLMFYVYVQVIFIVFPWAETSKVFSLIKGVIYTLLTIAVAFGLHRIIRFLSNLLKRNIESWKDIIIKPIKIRELELIRSERIIEILKQLVFVVQVFLDLLILYLFIPIVFSFFEFTKTWAEKLFAYILKPLNVALISLLDFLPNLFFILIIIFIARAIIKGVKLFFNEIERGYISFPRFSREWASPTFNIIRVLIIAFTFITIFPYLPGSQSEAFKGVSIFLGILLSLGSTSVIANIVAGTVLTYMSAFKIGDRVKIGEDAGDVIEKTMLVTRIQTVKNVIVTIPNSSVLGSHIINYTTSAETEGLVLHTTITLGYDVPWRKVHETLKTAALATPNVLSSPEPFILQTGLDDNYVRYELNVYTEKPGIMAKIYSELYQNIQDKCNEVGIEILSPSYTAVRDGNRKAVPDDYLPKNYKSPGFSIGPVKFFNKKDTAK